jgi:hypothetical protein
MRLGKKKNAEAFSFAALLPRYKTLDLGQKPIMAKSENK